MVIQMFINVPEVLKAVGRKTAYRGGKMATDPKGAEDPELLERIATEEEDNEELLDLFRECQSEVARTFAGALVHEVVNPLAVYCLTIRVGQDFNMALLPSLNDTLKRYYIEGVLGKWYQYIDGNEAAVHEAKASELLSELREATVRRVFERKMFP